MAKLQTMNTQPGVHGVAPINSIIPTPWGEIPIRLIVMSPERLP